MVTPTWHPFPDGISGRRDLSGFRLWIPSAAGNWTFLDLVQHRESCFCMESLVFQEPSGTENREVTGCRDFTRDDLRYPEENIAGYLDTRLTHKNWIELVVSHILPHNLTHTQTCCVQMQRKEYPRPTFHTPERFARVSWLRYTYLHRTVHMHIYVYTYNIYIHINLYLLSNLISSNLIQSNLIQSPLI